MLGNNDQLALLDDTLAPETGLVEEICWYLLIVDDDEDVHHATEFALSDLRVLGRPLKFLHAFSAAEAISLLALRRDVAVILLDVVMEREDAGLKAVEAIRCDLGLDAVRIVLDQSRDTPAAHMSVFLAGGEPLLQADFAAGVLDHAPARATAQSAPAVSM